MGFQVSPGVNVSEIDLTTVVPAVSTTEGAIAGVFNDGPVDQRVLISSEDELVQRFGKPNARNVETFFTAASFLSYGNKLYVVRAYDSSLVNSTTPKASGASVATQPLIKNDDEITDNINIATDVSTYDANIAFFAKSAGTIGSSLRISACYTADQYQQTGIAANTTAHTSVTNTEFAFVTGSNTVTVTITATDTGDTTGNTSSNSATDAAAAAVELIGDLFQHDIIVGGNTTIGKQDLRISSNVAAISITDDDTGSYDADANTTTKSSTFDIDLKDKYLISSNTTLTSVTRRWEHYNLFNAAPGTTAYTAGRNANSAIGDEIHLVIIDELGKVSGTPDTVIETWGNLSRSRDAKTDEGNALYYPIVLRDQSAYVGWSGHPTGVTANTAVNLAGVSGATPYRQSFSGGVDSATEAAIAPGSITRAYDKFASAEDVDISLVLAGKALGGTHGELVANHIIDNICEVRKDCVAFISPERGDTVNNLYGELDSVIEFRNALRASSYAVMDSSYKVTYNKYSDVFVSVPMNGDVAGLAVRTDNDRDPWFSPAGFNRGQVKNIVKLAFNPNKAARDQLYKADINPITSFPGQGTVLFGDKTLLGRPSAFDRINVRRLFIVLEKAIARAAQSTLFEFNDEFTRSQFKNLVEPFLRDVQGRRGIYDFKVVCDDTNNTGEVIDRNEFVGDIYIKPAKSINFIQLNFVAVRTGVEFSEIVGQF